MDVITWHDTKKRPETTGNLISWFPRPFNWALVDNWVPMKEDIIFKSMDKAIILPVSKYYGFEESTDLDYFMIAAKRSYNKPKLRNHITHYLNYFETFYDTEHELVAIMYQIKYIMDYHKEYTKSNFIDDLRKYIIYNRLYKC